MERRLKDSDPDSMHPAFGALLPGTGDHVLAQVKSVLSVNNMPNLNTHWYLDISLANWKKALGGATRHCAYSEGVPVNCNVHEAGEQ